jgi:hypothetical protein
VAFFAKGLPNQCKKGKVALMQTGHPANVKREGCIDANGSPGQRLGLKPQADIKKNPLKVGSKSALGMDKNASR